jgi:HAMP domain-containing protein
MARKIELEVELNGIGKINKEIDSLENSLMDMKRQLDGIDKTSGEFSQLSQAILETEKRLNDLGGATNDLIGEQITLNQQIGEAEDKLMLMAQAGDTSTQAYKELLSEVGQMKKIQMETTIQIDRAAAGFTGKLTVGIQRVAAAYQVGMAATQMFGVESEKAQKIMAQLQAVMAFTQGLEQLKQLTVGMNLFGKSGISALSGIQKAIVATGIGALVVAVGLLVAYWEDIVKLIGLGGNEQEELVKSAENRVKLAQDELDVFDMSVNSLKLQGKSEKEILKLRMEKIDAIIKEQEIYISALEERRRVEIENAKQNKAITEGIIRGMIEFSTLALRLIAAPIDILIATVNKVSDVLGFGKITTSSINAEITKLNTTLSEKAAGLIFDPEKIAEEGQASIDEAKSKLNKLISDRDGMRLQIQGIEKQEVENSKSSEEEKQQKLQELRKQELEIIKEIDARKRDAEKSSQDLSISLMEEGFEKQKLILERQYGDERQSMIDRSNGLEIAAVEERYVMGLIDEEEYLTELQKLRNDDSKLTDEERKLLLLKEQKLNDDLSKLQIDINNKKRDEKEKYDQWIRKNTLSEAELAKADARQTYADELEQFKKLLDDKVIGQKEYDEAIIISREKLNEKLNEIDNKANEERVNKSIMGLKQISDAFSQLQNSATGMFAGIGASISSGLSQILEIGEMKFNKFETKIQNVAQEVNAYAQAIGGMIQSILGAVSQEQEMRLEEGLARVEELYNQETLLVLTQLEQGVINEEEAAKKKFQIDLKRFNEEEKLRRDAFESEKSMKIASTITSGLSGAVQAFAGAMQLGPIAGPIVGAFLAAAVLGMSALNVAQIEATKYRGGTPPSMPMGMGSPPTIPQSAGGSAPTPSTTTLFGSPMTGGNTGGGENELGGRQGMVRAYVLETDITNTQNTISTYEQRAEIG